MKSSNTSTNTSPKKTTEVNLQAPDLAEAKHVLTPTKYRLPEEEYGNNKEWENVTMVESPYDSTKMCHKTVFKDGDVYYSRAFDIDTYSQYPEHAASCDPGPRPETPTAERPNKKRKDRSAKKKLHW